MTNKSANVTTLGTIDSLQVYFGSSLAKNRKYHADSVLFIWKWFLRARNVVNSTRTWITRFQSTVVQFVNVANGPKLLQ